MVNRLSVFLSTFFVTGFLAAQDMPPLPPLPDQGQATNPTTAAPLPSDNTQAGNLPPLPGSPEPASAPSPSPDNGQATSLPPLPGTPSTSASPTDNGQAATLPPLPNTQAPATQESGQTPALPPLPGNQAPETTAAPAENGQTPALPPLPGNQAPATTASQPATTATTQAPATETAPTAETKPAKEQAEAPKPWTISKYRPNVIFGGWVRAKGGNEKSRIAWASQEVLNALLLHKYKLISPDEGKPEEGAYEGQGKGRLWRQWTFHVPKSKLTVSVFVRQDGHKRVWVRVGGPEAVPTSIVSLAQAKKMQQADLTVLHLLQKKFGRRLSPNRYVPDWDAPYRYAEETADH